MRTILLATALLAAPLVASAATKPAHHVAKPSHSARHVSAHSTAPNADHSADQLNARSLQNAQGGQTGAPAAPAQ